MDYAVIGSGALDLASSALRLADGSCGSSKPQCENWRASYVPEGIAKVVLNVIVVPVVLPEVVAARARRATHVQCN